MLDAPMPFALASSANCPFQPSKPAGPLAHWAASAFVLRHTRTAMAAKAAVASFLLPVIPKLLITASAPNSPRSAKAHIPPDFAERQPPEDGFCRRRQGRHPAWLRQLPARRADWRSKIRR